MQSPCMGCPDKCVGCHNDQCIKWSNWTKAEKERKARIQKAKFNDRNFYSYVYSK